MNVTFCDIGSIPYEKALKLQTLLSDARRRDEIQDTVLFLEHPHVLTKGTRANEANIYLSRRLLEEKGINVYEVNRGGDVTYHGPGQLVVYPIVQLRNYEQGIRGFIRTMEDSLIDLLEESFRIRAYAREGKYTGVWVGDCKIAAFGLSVSGGVTMHGFAFNVNTDLSYFNLINPCGLSLGVTSVARELGRDVPMREMVGRTAESLTAHFKWEPEHVSPEELAERIHFSE